MLNESIFYIGNNPVTILSILKFILIMIAAFWASRLVIRALKTFSEKRAGIHQSLVYRVTRLIHYLILSIGFLIALTSLGFDFTNLILLASALGVGLGFGLQSIFNNFISGIIILFENHLKIGDFIELESGLRGEVREINFRSMLLRTGDGIDVIVPNSEAISNKILNWTLRDPYRRVRIPFYVGYGTDKNKMAAVIIEAAKKVPGTLVKTGVSEPVVYFTKFGDNGLEFELAVWVDEIWAKRTHNTTSAYLWAIDDALKQNGFDMPIPQREILLRTTKDT